VYDGDVLTEPPASSPIAGVRVELWCAGNPYPDKGSLLDTAQTDSGGWYSLDAPNDNCEYLHIIETDPAGYVSAGASSVSGAVQTSNWIQYTGPVSEQTLTGNKFWDLSPATITPSVTPTATPTRTFTPTKSPSPTGSATRTLSPTPTASATRTAAAPLTVTLTSTATPTPTPIHIVTFTATATPTASATTVTEENLCLNLVANSHFESGLRFWHTSGAVGIDSPGFQSDHSVAMGGADNASAEMWQAVAVPAGASPLRVAFDWRAVGDDGGDGDVLHFGVRHGDDIEWLVHLHPSAYSVEWGDAVLDLASYAGQYVDLLFRVTTDAGRPTTFWIDWVGLQPCGASAWPANAWQFDGHVFVGEPESTTPARYAQVSVFGAPAPGEPVELLASTQTSSRGEFSLELRTYARDDLSHIYLAVDDANYDTIAAVAGPEGEAIPPRVHYAEPPPGVYDGSRFYVQQRPGPFVPIQVAVLPVADKEPDHQYYTYDAELKIKGIEVTQAIQCFDQSTDYSDCPDNSLELTQGKDTMVRVYIECTNCTDASYLKYLKSVRVDLTASAFTSKMMNKIGQYAAILGGSTVTQHFDVPVGWSTGQMRGVATGTANFLVTDADGKNLVLNVTVNSDKYYHETDYSNNSLARTFALHWRQPIYMLGVPTQYRPSASKLFGLYSGLGPADSNRATDSVSLLRMIAPRLVYYKASSVYWLYGSHTNPDGTHVTCHTCKDIRDDQGAALLAKLSTLYSSSALWTSGMKPDALVAFLPAGAASRPGAPQSLVPCSGRLGSSAYVAQNCSDGYGSDSTNLAYQVARVVTGLPNANANTCVLSRSIGEVGWNTASGSVVGGDTRDILDGFNLSTIGKWISPYLWNKMSGKADSKQWSTCGAAAPVARALTRTQASSEPRPAVLMSGRVLSDATAVLDPFYQFTSAGVFAESDPDGAYCIDLQTAGGAPLASHCFGLVHAEQGDAEPDDAPFAFVVPMPSAAQRAILRRGATTLAERVATGNAPQVAFIQPQAGAVISASSVISWTAGDADGDALSYGLLYSRDDGASWLPISIDLAGGAAMSLEGDLLGGSDTARLRLWASDGFNTTSVDSAAFLVARKPPVVSISSPAAGTVLDPAAPVALEGAAVDLEDGAVTGEGLVWRSDRQGVVAQGEQWFLGSGALERGWHTLSLTATDSDGMSAAASVRVLVGYALSLPIILLAQQP